MDKVYSHKDQEDKVYKMWEEINAFSPENVQKLKKDSNIPTLQNTYTVLMPPPNANAPLHCGHATYSIQDLMIRFKRMQGFNTLYLPGTDHAGFETQYVYEKKLEKEGKSRFDFDKGTLYKKILEFVKANSSVALSQLKRLGMSADWEKNTFTLDKKVIDLVYATFKKMCEEGYVYREGYIVNYSTYHGTTFSDLETEYKETVSPLYYVKYPVKDSDTYISVATVRPETVYADVAIAVNPKDARYKKHIGKTVINPLNTKELPVISDDYVDIEFGTGVLKITPGHDPHDFEIGKKNNLEILSVIGLDGKMRNTEDGIDGLYPNQARIKVAEILRNKGALEKIDENYKNNVLVDYKDKKPIEPMVLPNWFIKTDRLFDKVIEVVERGEVKFNRDLWKKEILRWLKEKKPWPISRQIVFGISIPAWYSVKDNPNLFISFINSNGKVVGGNILELSKEYDLGVIKSGLQKLIAPESAKYVISVESPGEEYIQETDTFDTWFSSGQWPLVTTGYPNGALFEKYYPTDFLDSMWDIMFFWIARMLMFGLYLTGKVPFKNVYFHGAITDKHGVKMSKSKGNVVDPMDFIEKYGADALRMGILVGGNPASRMTPLDEDKVRGYRNFANKIWNLGRFINLQVESGKSKVKSLDLQYSSLKEGDKQIINNLNDLIIQTTNYLEEYKFKLAGEALYQFIWEDFANNYLESIKNRADVEIVHAVLMHVYSTCLKLLHPFMPFVTEAIWQELKLGELKIKGNHKYLILCGWPTTIMTN